MVIDNKNYILEIKQDGIYLYKRLTDEEQLATDFSAIDLKKNKLKGKNIHDKILLEKITLLNTSYELAFAIIDAIVNRSLQRNFSFETDSYAQHLRIIFSMLVPSFGSEQLRFGHAYDASNLKGETIKFDVIGFIAIKRLLDSDKTIEDKINFLGIIDSRKIDLALSSSLELYHSDDSDSEAEHSDSDEPTPSLKFIHSIPGDLTPVGKDRDKLNQFLKGRDPTKHFLELSEGKVKIGADILSTEFVIPGFRGINHMPLRFSDDVRRRYRKQDLQSRRTQIPYYSESVLMSRFDFYRDKNGIESHLVIKEEDNKNKEGLDQNAVKLENCMLDMRDGDYVLVTGLSNGSATDVRLFSNFLYFLQHLYSNGIIKSQNFLRENLIAGNEKWFPLLNAYNPFVSESELPEHALRYSFGQKSLYEFAALQPHYDKDGKPSFPYVGEICLSLRGMDVFTSKRERHQLRKLEKMYKVNPSIVIGPEIESTGFAWLPAGEVIFSAVVKCPSFKGHWKKIYFEKYGLTKTNFHNFKRNFEKSRSKDDRLKIEENLINSLLIPHYSDLLLNQAAEYSKEHNKVLVFLKSDGTLDFKLPHRDMKKDADADAKKVRETIERTLKDEAKKGIAELEVQLTSKKMKVYRMAPIVVERIIRQHSSQFFSEEEKLRTPLSALSSPRMSRSSSSIRTGSFYSYTGSPNTPLSALKYDDFSYHIENEDPQEEYENLLTEQKRLLGQLNLVLSDYEILEFYNSTEITKKKLYGITAQIIQYDFSMRKEHTEHHIKDWYLNLGDQRFFFDETRVDGDGWCLLSAVGIIEPELAIDKLIQKIKEPVLGVSAKNHLFKAIVNNIFTSLITDLSEGFMKDQVDQDENLIVNKIKKLYASDSEDIVGHDLMQYLGRNDVLEQYLIYIKKAKYVDKNIACALVELDGKKLVVLTNYRNNGELSYLNCSSDELDFDNRILSRKLRNKINFPCYSRINLTTD